ncbi:MAG: tyrosine-type recombinase/integrase [Terriglobales bacterium]|jgi:integrase/recombinase XerC
MPAIPGPASLNLVEGFLTHCSARNFSAHTLRAYRADLTRFVAFAGEDTAVDRKLVRRFLVQLYNAGLKPTSVRRQLAAVKSFCRWLEAEGLLEAGLIDYIASRYRRDELPDVPNVGEVTHLIEGEILQHGPANCAAQKPERDRLALELLYGCGLRASELVGINCEDFHGEDVLLIRGKGKKERQVIVGECARAALKAWLPVRQNLLQRIHLKTPALFFGMGRGKVTERLDVRSVRRIVGSAAKARGLDPEKWHPHLLRHAYATHLCDNGASLQSVSVLLGHAKISTTQIYTRVSTGRLKRSYDAAHPHAQK